MCLSLKSVCMRAYSRKVMHECEGLQSEAVVFSSGCVIVGGCLSLVWQTLCIERQSWVDVLLLAVTAFLAFTWCTAPPCVIKSLVLVAAQSVRCSLQTVCLLHRAL
jgi:hypothetical protein